MLQFLNPIWLFAIAAVAIPIAIHLWNIRPGKVLKVGSISLMDAASRKSSRSFKLLDIPLFILRCLLLVVLALLLAIPLWRSKLETAKTKGWILVPKESFIAAYPKFKKSIDSLSAAGFEFHFFNTGFPKSDLKQVLLNPKDSLKTAVKHLVNYWNLVSQLDTTISSTLPVFIFTPNQAGYFKGNKPQVALSLRWQTYVAGDSTSTWIAGAWFNNTNTISVAQGNSKPSVTNYTYTNIQAGDQPNSPYNVTVNNGQATVSLKTANQQAVAVDTSNLRIAIYADNNSTDAAYLEAALKAVSQFTQRKTIIKQYANPAAIPANQTWLFWLAEKPVDDRLLKNIAHTLNYERGKVVNSNSWIDNNGSYSLGLQQDQKINLFKLVATDNTTGELIWRDGYGHPVLSVQKNNYHFYSRFNPTWNDLVWSNEFPSWIMKLMIGDEQSTPIDFDKRTIAQQQLIPVNENTTHNTATKLTGTVNMANYCWVLLALLFMAERWMANRTQKITTNG